MIEFSIARGSILRLREPLNLKILIVGQGSAGSRYVRDAISLGHEPGVVTRRGKGPHGEIFHADGLVEGIRLFSPDAVVVATETARHVSDCVVAMDAGLSVLVEKPLAMSAAEAAPVFTHRGRGQVFVAHPLRFSSSLRAMREAIQSAGGVVYGTFICGQHLEDWRPARDYRSTYSASKSKGGGVVLDLIHEIDALQWLVGLPHEVVSTEHNSMSLETDSEQFSGSLFRWHGGGTAVLVLDYLRRPRAREYVVVTETATFRWSMASWSAARSDSGGTRTLAVDESSPSVHVRMLSGFIDAVRGEPSLLATPEDAQKSLRLVDAMKSSVRLRRWVTL